ESRDMSICLRSLSPPGRNPSLNATILHGGNMLLGHSLTGIVQAQRWIVVRKGIKALLIPGFREPGIVKRSPDREGRLRISLNRGGISQYGGCKVGKDQDHRHGTSQPTQ